MKNFLLLISFCLSVHFYGQEEQILKITFSSYGMVGPHEYIIVRPDSTFIGNYNHDKNNELTRFTELTSIPKWEQLLKSIYDYKLTDLENLPSPTSYRNSDGATFGSIMITTNKKEYYCGEFDNHNPNEKLNKLMDILLKTAVVIRQNGNYSQTLEK